MTAAASCRIAQALIGHAVADPDRVVLWDRVRSVTYAELDGLVGALAAELDGRRDLLGPAGLVPMLVGRDVSSAVAVHAALRAGVGFVPIDESLPPAAVERLLERIDGPRVAVVTAPEQAGRLPRGVLPLAVPRDGRAGVGALPVDPDDVAMITFTSGSSGEPKGVVSPWRAFEAYWAPMSAATPPGATDYRAVSLLPPSFAAGVVTLLRPSFGAAVSIIDPTALDPMSLLETFDRERLNLVVLVPSLVASVMGRWPAGRRLESVDTVLVFGEPLEWPMVSTLRSILPERAVIVNSYGATETVVIVAERRIASDEAIGVGRVPLGRPLTPGRIRLEPLSQDEDAPTEMVVVGDVAAGYWRDDELTERSFGRDPDGTRFWRSGDLARVDASGQIHFVGRRDNVVKINGRLVEPSEPERVLAGVPGIRRAVVLVQDAPLGGSRLVAHVEVDPGAAVAPADVRAALAAQLAGHLVPAVIVRHERLPANDGGKVDRQALMSAAPVPWHERTTDRSPSLNEQAVLGVAAEVLGYDGFGPDDDLWDLGLDSLGATEVLSALEGFGWPWLPESALLEHRTVAAVAALRGSFVPGGTPIWLHRDGAATPVVCVLGPASDALTFRRLAQRLAPDHPVGILRQLDPSSTAPPPRTVAAIAAGLRQVVDAELAGRSAVMVGYSGSGVVAYELARQRAEAGAADRVVLLDALAGADTADRLARDGVRGRAVARRLRRGARRAWLRTLPPTTMPPRERSYALFDAAERAAADYRVPATGLPVVLFRARRSGLVGLAGSWGRAAADLTVIDLDCDHEEILGPPHVDTVAGWISSGSRRPP